MHRAANDTQLEFRTRRHRPQWRRAYRALRELLDDPQRTHLAFEVALALDGGSARTMLERMLALPAGRRLFHAQPSLLDALGNRAALEAMPAGSLGRAYLAHIDEYGLEPAKLVELGRREGCEGASDDPDIRWAAERGSLGHDLWHVLTGYGADPFGEAALLWFSWAQTGGRANLVLGLGAAARVLPHVGLAWPRYIAKAWRRGRAAVCLAALPFEDLLPLPLAEVRGLAGIEAAAVAHPAGVLRGSA